MYKIFENKLFLKDIMKKVYKLIFSFAPNDFFLDKILKSKNAWN